MQASRKGSVKKITRFFTLFSLILVIGVSYGFSRKVASLPELLNVETLRVKHDRFFLIEGATIFIYSLNDFKLIKKIGRKGEGPREFKVDASLAEPLRIEIHPKYILANSMGKISFFTLDGEFIKEMRAINVRLLQPFGENFVGESFIMVKNILYRTINIYDPGVKKIKEVYREKFYIQPGQTVVLDETNDKVRVFNDKIFISGIDEFKFNIYDKDGKLINTIKREFEKRKLLDKHKKEIIDYVRIEHSFLYKYLGNRLELPDYFPPILNFYVDSKHFYVGTFIEKDGKMKFLIFDAKGKYLRTVFLPIFKKSLIEIFPLGFYKGKLYQVVENEETEEWGLHVTDIPGK